MTATGLVCGSCGTELSPKSKFCNECGAPITQVRRSAEYKQVTVLFADVVHSMDIAASVGAERLREIMADLADRCAAVVRRYGGTVDKFTGDGIMAVFGAPTALEDHALRGCLAALGVQQEAKRLAVDVQGCDGVDLMLRVGLNSGQVIAGEIGSGSFGYTTIGEQVGMAQRMESVAPPGGVTLSESTARLVEKTAMLGDLEMAPIKGGHRPVPARQLLGIAGQRELAGSGQAALVGRDLELTTLAGLLDRAAAGHGAVVCVAGPAGIGKTRLVGEAVRFAIGRGVDVFFTFCESHTSDVPFHAVARLLREAAGITDLGDEAARRRVNDQLPDAGEEDVLLLYDLVGIRDPEVALPTIDPDARRRRLTALINSLAQARSEPAIYVIEDVHWIDEVSESMFSDFVSAIARTRSLVLITYRPEYEGALANVTGTQTISLTPLTEAETNQLLADLLGSDASVAAIKTTVAGRAAGNPFFIQEMVRELGERGVLEGDRGGYTSSADVAEVHVPATVQATIAARIDRLGGAAKRTLNAAAVIGSRFEADLLACVDEDVALAELVDAELLDQVTVSPRAEYAFDHPLIRAVAYESQLRSDRSLLHQRVATAIQQRDPSAVEENAALIATHLEAAGDLRAAWGWHMRAATWLTDRDVRAARASWLRAREVADRLPDDDPDRTSMRIGPRTLICGYAWRAGGGGFAEAGLNELRDLCGAAGDQMSLVMGMSGVLVSMTLNHELHQLRTLATEYVRMLESIGDPALIVGLLNTATHAKLEAGEITNTLPLIERVIELADGRITMGNFFFESPLAWTMTLRSLANCSLGRRGWRDDLTAGLAMAREVQRFTQIVVTTYGYVVPVMNGALIPDAAVIGHTADSLRTAERSGDDVSLAWARVAHGIMLVRVPGGDWASGMELLAKGRQQASRHADLLTVTMADIQTAECIANAGDLGAAIEIAEATVGHLLDSNEVFFRGPAWTVLVESLLRRGSKQDLQQAQAAIERLAACPSEPGFVLYELALLRLRALFARARDDDQAYGKFVKRYRDMARSLDFEGHMERAGAMS
ncbi:AAA family ATPase [Mycobacterium fragae]|uniref:Cyclase n=1 Tax=Mycobacterium fragae TaxID=1260918 RepID=A0A1X1V4J0_9MYCO|nr:AAA family ATPase [Mycobacterium fragae]ORV63980.1 cyclase [Mycobacterium fragae]